jgi:phosphoribosylanthranilate isomerase
MTGHPAATALHDRIAQGGIVKICGLREPEHAVAAASAGADLIGFIFAPAKRRITPERASEAIAAARAAAVGPLWAVGVFVDADAEEIDEVARISGIDIAQLHGDESRDLPALLRIPSTKAFQPEPSMTLERVETDIDGWMSTIQPPVAVLVDGYHPGAAGGTGARADWNLVSALATRVPLMLAGGLDPDNVGDAIRLVQPLGVDVSSGVERGGAKDADLIARFVANARAAFAGTAHPERG